MWAACKIALCPAQYPSPPPALLLLDDQIRQLAAHMSQNISLQRFNLNQNMSNMSQNISLENMFQNISLGRLNLNQNMSNMAQNISLENLNQNVFVRDNWTSTKTCQKCPRISLWDAWTKPKLVKHVPKYFCETLEPKPKLILFSPQPLCCGEFSLKHLNLNQSKFPPYPRNLWLAWFASF